MIRRQLTKDLSSGAQDISRIQNQKRLCVTRYFNSKKTNKIKYLNKTRLIKSALTSRLKSGTYIPTFNIQSLTTNKPCRNIQQKAYMAADDQIFSYTYCLIPYSIMRPPSCKSGVTGNDRHASRAGACPPGTWFVGLQRPYNLTNGPFPSGASSTRITEGLATARHARCSLRLTIMEPRKSYDILCCA